MEEKIVRIVNAMAEFLSIEQLKKLQEVIVPNLLGYPVIAIPSIIATSTISPNS